MIIKFTDDEYRLIKNLLLNANINPSEKGLNEDGTIRFREVKVISLISNNITKLINKKFKMKITPSDLFNLNLSTSQRKIINKAISSRMSDFTDTMFEKYSIPKGLILRKKKKEEK